MADLFASDVDYLRSAKKRITDVMFGIDEIVNILLLTLVARGHVLLEGNPGLGKTVLVKTLRDALNLGENAYKRIQFTPDLMPSDITGTERPVAGEKFTLGFVHGPVFCDLLLADEINRATPKTQSAMLEAMAEFQVTVLGKERTLIEPIEHVVFKEQIGSESEKRVEIADVPTPFFVLATQNPVEQEGTYPLPEAQLDRFLVKIRMPFPERDILNRILYEDRAVMSGVKRGAHSGGDALGRQEALGRLFRLGQALRSCQPGELVKAHILNMVLASTGKFDQIAGVSSRRQRALQDFCRDRVEYPLGPRAAAAMSVGALGWSLLENEGKTDTAALETFSKIGLAATVVPALRHRIKFRSHFDEGFGAGAQGVGTAADREDDLIQEFAKLAAPDTSGYDGDFAAAFEGISGRYRM